MSHPFFAYIARMRYIVRWGLMRNTMQENIQEHSHMVAVLAHALAVIRRDKFGGTVDPGRVAAVALYHDAPEIFTGDLPTPVKYANPAIQTAYKAVEADAAQRLVAMLLCPKCSGNIFAAGNGASALVIKAQDGWHTVPAGGSFQGRRDFLSIANTARRSTSSSRKSSCKNGGIPLSGHTAASA